MLRITEEAVSLLPPAIISRLAACGSCSGSYRLHELYLCARHEAVVRQALGIREEHEMRDNWRMSFGGWTLNGHRDHGYWHWSASAARYAAPCPPSWVTWTLDMTMLPLADLNRLRAVRDMTGCHLHLLPPDAQYAGFHGLIVSTEEAERIRAGAHPMEVLLPPLYARALTREELMSA